MAISNTAPRRIERPLLGIVGLNGAIYYTGDICDCRGFLEQRGLECLPRGWFSADCSWRGLIDFHNGSYYAAMWREE